MRVGSFFSCACVTVVSFACTPAQEQPDPNAPSSAESQPTPDPIPNGGGGADPAVADDDDSKVVKCGGMDLATCPKGTHCIDDATDGCDPKSGGVSCPGVCVPD